LAAVRVDRYAKLYSKQATEKDTLDAAIAHLAQQQQLKAQYQANLDLAHLGSRMDKIKAQRSQVKALSAKMESLEWSLDQKKRYAPETGIIFDTFFVQGEFVGQERPVLALLTPDHIRIEFFMPLQDMHKIKNGQEIYFTCAGCPKRNKAIIGYISPRAEYLPPLVYSRDNSDKLVFRIKAQIPNATEFKPGQPVWVSLS
jgi:HlyD family secretion protein